jgi:thiol-disulfide isomerase/thioredoxin
MVWLLGLLLAVVLAAPAAAQQIVREVRAALNAKDLDRAEALVESYRQQRGQTSELAAAVSWLARGAFQNGEHDRALRHAGEARRLASELLQGATMANDPPLAIAMGAAIEVEAGTLAAQARRSEAVALLRREVKTWAGSPIETRIRKNINLLALEGELAPEITAREWIGDARATLSQLRGRPVLLFFWAHWCSDCKAQGPILARLRQQYGPRGLVIISPTQSYGYAAGGEDATPEEEKQHIASIWAEHFPALQGVAVPVSEHALVEYGSSTTPTLVLVDAAGRVRLYHPGRMAYDDLAAAIEKLLQVS